MHDYIPEHARLRTKSGIYMILLFIQAEQRPKFEFALKLNHSND